jgi:predicted proteasome-type protease
MLLVNYRMSDGIEGKLSKLLFVILANGTFIVKTEDTCDIQSRPDDLTAGYPR